MIKHLISFFKKPKKTKFFIFDGDQNYLSAYASKVCVEREDSSYVWVTVSTIPKVLKHISGLDVYRPSNVGKEASDNAIAMLLVLECARNKNLRECYIFSSDGDMVDIMINSSREFPDIKFFLCLPKGGKTCRKASDVLHNLPKNCYCLRIKK